MSAHTLTHTQQLDQPVFATLRAAQLVPPSGAARNIGINKFSAQEQPSEVVGGEIFFGDEIHDSNSCLKTSIAIILLA